MIKQLFLLPKIKFRFGFGLLVFIFLISGCSKKLDSPYKYGHKPPPKSSKQKTQATQRPYTIKGKKYTPMASAHGYVEKGLASWYGKKFHGRKTSNGETYDMYAMTAAHKTLPMGTWVKVNNLGNKGKGYSPGKGHLLFKKDQGPSGIYTSQLLEGQFYSPGGSFPDKNQCRKL